MVTATSTLCTAVFHDLGLRLAAGVPTPISAEQAAQIQTFPGIEIVSDPEPSTIHPFEEA